MNEIEKIVPLKFLEKKLLDKNKEYAVLFNSGSFNPIHRKHIEAFKIASKYLKKQGIETIGGYLSPASPKYLNEKMKNTNEKPYKYNDRVNMCKLAVLEENKLNKLDFEIKISKYEKNEPNSVKVYNFINKQLKKYFKSFKNLHLYYIVGSDVFIKYNMFDTPYVVVIQRPNYEVPKNITDNKQKHIFICNSSNNSSFSSSLLRNKLKKHQKLNKITYNLVEYYLYNKINYNIFKSFQK